MLSGEEAGGDPCWVEYSWSTFDLDTNRETVPDARSCLDHAVVDVGGFVGLASQIHRSTDGVLDISQGSGGRVVNDLTTKANNVASNSNPVMKIM